MPLILGVDSSTQSCKALLVDSETGEVVDQRTGKHPAGTTIDPRIWLDTLDQVAGPLLPRADAVAVGGQQHGMVALDADGEPVHDALLWNDLRSAPDADQLVEELGGPAACAAVTGSVLNASFTAAKLRWLAGHDPEAAARVHRVLLPHDYLTWHLAGRNGEPATDRGDASGTGYFDTANDRWLPEVVERALGHAADTPRLAAPAEQVGTSATGSRGAVIAPGTGDNAAAALGLDLRPGDVAISIGTSGVASMVTDEPIADPSGSVAGFADATGRFLPLALSVNCAKVLDLGARLLGVDHDGLAQLAQGSVPGAHGLTLLPYLDGERTPNRPDAVGTLHGITSQTTREDVARAYIEGMLLSLADALRSLQAASGATPERVLLIGGGARSAAVRAFAPGVLGLPITLPDPGEYVALGAARQAAWTLAGTDAPPIWKTGSTALDPTGGGTHDGTHDGAAADLHDRYALLRDRTAPWEDDQHDRPDQPV